MRKNIKVWVLAAGAALFIVFLPNKPAYAQETDTVQAAAVSEEGTTNGKGSKTGDALIEDEGTVLQENRTASLKNEDSAGSSAADTSSTTGTNGTSYASSTTGAGSVTETGGTAGASSTTETAGAADTSATTKTGSTSYTGGTDSAEEQVLTQEGADASGDAGQAQENTSGAATEADGSSQAEESTAESSKENAADAAKDSEAAKEAAESTPAQEKTETQDGLTANAVTTSTKTRQTVWNGVDYSPVYDYDYYINEYADLKAAFGDNDFLALQHFVTYGMKERRQAISTFHVDSYRRSYADLRLAFGSNYPEYYLHYVRFGQKEGRTSTTGVDSILDPVTVKDGVDYSPVYDYNYYINKYADLKAAFKDNDIAALNHFVTYGMKEERQASSSFESKSYRYAYEDLRKAFGYNYASYYKHYLNFGQSEGRSQTTGVTKLSNYAHTYHGVDLSSVYDFNYYMENNPDLKKVYRDMDDEALLEHFMKYGIEEGRRGASGVSSAEQERLKLIYEESLTAGTKYDKIDLSDVYDYFYYAWNNTDVTKVLGYSSDAVLGHYADYGIYEGRTGKADASSEKVAKVKEQLERIKSGLPDKLYLKEESSGTCTLTSAVMMLRAAAYILGRSDWADITQAKVKATSAWVSGVGLSWYFTYDGLTVSHNSVSSTLTEAERDTFFQELLKEHPEGVVLYHGGSYKPHAVFLTDYTDGTYYCADPSPYYAKGRITLSKAYSVNIKNTTAYWYISSPDVTWKA